MFKILSIFMLALALVSCNKKNLDQGGQDSGGGDTSGSRAAQVEALLSEPEYLEKDLQKIFENLKSIEGSKQNEQRFAKGWADRFDKSDGDFKSIIQKIELKETCKDLHDNEKTGSVSAFSMDATICLSKQKLSKNLPEVLKKQTHALIFHEISHLMGLDENNAQATQDIIIKYYDKLTKSGSTYHMQKQFLTSSIKARKAIQALVKIVVPRENVCGFLFVPKALAKIEGVDVELRLVASAALVLEDQLKTKSSRQHSNLIDMLHRATQFAREIQFEVAEHIVDRRDCKETKQLYGNVYAHLLELEHILQ